MKHYEIMKCRCGRFWWVLQPLRNGPFEAFRWTSRESALCLPKK
jgi:hypothetical protein